MKAIRKFFSWYVNSFSGLLSVGIAIFDVVLWIWIFQNQPWIKFRDNEVRLNPSVQVAQIEIKLPTPIVNPGGLYDYCTVTEKTDNADRLRVGTPVPMAQLPIKPTAVEPTVQPTGGPTETKVPENIPTAVPTKPPVLKGDFKVINTGGFKPTNYQFVFVGVGMSPQENRIKLSGLINEIRKDFDEINVDFNYVDTPVDAKFNYVDTLVGFQDDRIREEIFNAIKSKHPIDGMIVAVKTDAFVGSSGGNTAITIIDDPNAAIVTRHEMGHQLSIMDGYTSTYPSGYLPNDELFYLDQLPNNLVVALNELGYSPPLYEMGTCNGRKVYSFYETANNLYGNYGPVGPNSWGNSAFTPLQKIIMNDYVRFLKGGN